MSYDLSKARLINAVNANRMPHALLLSDASGQECPLWDFAAKLYLCDGDRRNGPCCDCPSCRRYDAGNHADFIHIEDEKAVKIDSIRELGALLGARALSGRRAVVIRRAHMMTPQAQNALLKSIEEPLGDTLFILTAVGALLPTLRSRMMELRAFSGEAEQGFPIEAEAAAQKGLSLAHGEPVSLERGEDAGELLAVWEQLFGAALSQAYGRKSRQSAWNISENAQRSAKSFTTARLLFIMDTIYNAKKRLRSNANPQMTMDYMAAELHNAGNRVDI